MGPDTEGALVSPGPSYAAADATGADSTHGHDIAVVGTSAGGVAALQRLSAALPANLPAALFVVMHHSPERRSELPAILSRSGRLPAVAAEDGMPIVRGRILVAPSDHHLLIERGCVRVIRGPRENRHRPAIDPLFRSAAWAYGPRVVGVVLTGTLDDGTAGLWAVKSCGGVTVVQEPGDAEHPEMPMNALLHNRVDFRLPLEGIAELLLRLAARPTAPGQDTPAPSARLGDELSFARLGRDIEAAQKFGAPSPFTCPACGGALWELEEGGHLRYRCHTGHAFSQPSLLVEQDIAVEKSLYTALRTIEEKAKALRTLADRSGAAHGMSDLYRTRARALDETAATLRSMLSGTRTAPPETL